MTESIGVTGKIEIKRPEDLSGAELAEFIADLFHRMSVHETLWFREVEHQLGFEAALKAMDYAWEKTRSIAVKRVAELLGIETEAGLPKGLTEMPKEKQLQLAEAVAKNWLAQDGVWFQAVEFAEGMNDAKRCNDSVWGRFSPFEAHSIKKLLNLGEHPGLEGLEKALNFRVYGRLNKQSCRTEDGALIFEMNDCRVQSARVRKGLDDYPCKSAGLVEYKTFASAIDSRIKTECICCPPDNHPSTCFCAWKFTLAD